jgi:hypothetical protein
MYWLFDISSHWLQNKFKQADESLDEEDLIVKV